MMKKVIFICLLSLSTCLSLPDKKQELATQTPAGNATLTNDKEQKVAGATNISPAHPEVSQPITKNNETKPETVKPPPVVEKSNSTEPAPSVAPKENTDATKTTTNTNKTTDKEEPKKEETIVNPPKNETKTENATIPASLPDDKNPKKNETSTPTTSTLKPSEAPKATDVPPVHSRGFDGPSFIGGIILTLGLLAVGFMGFKYYKNQTERNYHTL